MHYAYVMCPKCRDKFVAVENLEALEARDKRRCPTCNNQYVFALLGEQEIDDTIYMITLDNSENFADIEQLRKRLNRESFDSEKIMCNLENGHMDSVIYRGDVLFTFLLMNALTDAGFCYTVTPEFPFESFIYPDIALCPTCGTPTVEKPVPESPQDMGFYCEKCNEWVMRGYL